MKSLELRSRPFYNQILLPRKAKQEEILIKLGLLELALKSIRKRGARRTDIKSKLVENLKRSTRARIKQKDKRYKNRLKKAQEKIGRRVLQNTIKSYLLTPKR